MHNKKYNANTSNIIAEIEHLLSQNHKVSVEYMDTYYLYGSDLNPMVILNRFLSMNSQPDYSVQIPIMDSKLKSGPSCVEYRNFYKFVNDNYGLKHVGPIKYPEFKFNALDLRRLAYNINVQGNVANQTQFIENLIVQLIDKQCPVDLIRRGFYYFDKPGQKTERFPPEFTMLNHDSKLIEYTTPRQNLWGFVNDKYARSLSPMDKEMQKVFDKVKSAVQNQRAK